MFGWLNWKTYLMIAVAVALALIAIGLIGGTGGATFITTIRQQAYSAGMVPWLADMIAIPLETALSGDILAAVIAGALWPVTLVWLILFFILMAYSILVPGAGAVGATYGA